jgi:hypothetical protein
MNPIVLVLAKQIFFVYGFTLLVTSSSILDPFREWVIEHTPWMYSPLSVCFKQYTFKFDTKHFIECRLCVGVWVSALAVTYYNTWDLYWIVFGISYFLCTQER